jgi:hypothetical protein
MVVVGMQGRRGKEEEEEEEERSGDQKAQGKIKQGKG